MVVLIYVMPPSTWFGEPRMISDDGVVTSTMMLRVLTDSLFPSLSMAPYLMVVVPTGTVNGLLYFSQVVPPSMEYQ